jgi:hypothetical protein
MKRNCLIILVLFVFAISTSAWSICPEEPNDLGLCDTIYVEPWQSDVVLQGDPPYFVRVPIYVTHDLADIVWDSIAGFCIPLCYTHTNPAKYCSLSDWWNETSLSGSSLPRSIFRHLDGVTNRMLWLYEQGEELAWDNRILYVSSDSSWDYYYHLNGDWDSAWVSPYFWLALLIGASEDRFWWEGSRTLLATMTFKVEDTMSICIDSCWWPPFNKLAFGSPDGREYVPRMGTPHDPGSYQVCFKFRRAPFVCGDVDGDGKVDLGDIVYLINYLYKGGPPPNPWDAGDVNDDGIINLGDLVYLINYVFKSGPAPDCW